MRERVGRRHVWIDGVGLVRFDPRQPRDDDGRWTKTGAAQAPSIAALQRALPAAAQAVRDDDVDGVLAFGRAVLDYAEQRGKAGELRRRLAAAENGMDEHFRRADKLLADAVEREGGVDAVSPRRRTELSRSPQIRAEWDQFNELSHEKHALVRDLAAPRREALVGALREIRPSIGRGDMPVGALRPNGLRPGSELTGATAEALEVLPKEWVDAARLDDVAFRALDRGRATYDDATQTLTVPPDASTVLHELGHRVQQTYGGGHGASHLNRLFDKWVEQRTQGDELRPLGDAYNANEVAVADHFATPYVGLHYPDGYAEAFTIGLEGTFYDRFSMRDADPEHVALTLGILVAA